MSLLKWMLVGFGIDLFLATQDRDDGRNYDKYSREERNALIATALRSSKRFKELEATPGMTPAKIIEILGLNSCTPKEFEERTGVVWPLK